MSNTQFDESEEALLSKGLKYNLDMNRQKDYQLLINSEISVSYLPNDVQDSARVLIDDELKTVVNSSISPVSFNNKNTSNKDWKTLKSIKTKIDTDNLTITKVDKGNAIAVMNTTDYTNKVNTFINENNITKLNQDPTEKFNKDTKKAIHDSTELFSERQKIHLKMIKPSAPTLQGLPKVHKDQCPIRPLVNYTNAPTYKLAKALDNIIKHTYKFKTNTRLTNSLDLITKIKGINIPDNATLLTFDIKNLFTKVPITETVNILKNNLEQQNKFETSYIAELINLVSLILQQNYFCFENEFYFQNEGLPMGSPISPIMADIFLDYIEEKQVLNTPNKHLDNIIYYFRYVDDIICLFKGTNRQISCFNNFLNNIHTNLEFTQEIEVNKSINYLDLTISNMNKEHSFKIFRKPTHTDTVIHATSNHPYNHKMASFNSMVHRLLKVPMNKEDYDVELNTIRFIATSNGYSAEIVDKIIKKKNKQQRKDPSEIPNKYIPHNFIGKESYKIQKVFKKKGYSTAFKTNKNLGHLLKQTSFSNTHNVQNSGIYKLKCNDCDSFYIGQTGRTFSQRFKEHINALKTQSTSSFADHLNSSNHSYSNIQNNLEILHTCKKGKLLDVLENLEIYRARETQPQNLLNDKLVFRNPLFDRIIKI